MKQENLIDKKTKADYKNWVPKRLLKAKIVESLVCLILFILAHTDDRNSCAFRTIRGLTFFVPVWDSYSNQWTPQ